MFYFGINDPIRRFCLNDDQIMGSHSPWIINILVNELFPMSHFYRLLQCITQKAFQKINYDPDDMVARVSLDDFRHNILELAGLCRADNATLLLISPPLCKERAIEWDRTDDVIRYRIELENLAKTRSLLLLKVEGLTEAAQLPTEQYFSDVVHLNDTGHLFLMEKLYQFLIGYNLLIKKQRDQL